jgi:hypothetical protein
MENRGKLDDLPSDVLEGAVHRGNEYAWTPEAFPVALERAEAHGLACLGGQFQFRLNDSTCEMYWLVADSTERIPGESWADYCRRSCSEVRENFERLVSITDFSKEAMCWNLPPAATRNLFFVAYFVTRAELAAAAYICLRRNTRRKAAG